MTTDTIVRGLAVGAKAAAGIRPRFTPIQTNRALSTLMVTGSTGGVYYSTIATAECPFSWVRVIFYNGSTLAKTVEGASVVASAAVNDYVNALDASGAYVTPTRLTFNDFAASTGAARLPPSNTGSNNTLTIPAATLNGGTADVIPGVAYSDWIQVRSLARTDGGTLPIVIVKAWSTTTGLPNVGDANSNSYDTIDQGRIWRTYVKAGGDVTLNSSAVTGTTRISTANLNIAIQTLCDVRGLTILGVGDSLTQGAQTTGNANSFGHIASAALSTTALPVSWVNFGIPGQDSLTANGSSLFQRVRNHIDELSPDVVFIPVYSPNDGHTQATADASYAKAIAMAEYARSKGVVPILTTPVPGGGTTALQDGYRLSARTRALASGFLVADFEGLGTGASPNRIQAGYDSGDGTHPNDAGQTFMASVVTPILRRILAMKQ